MTRESPAHHGLRAGIVSRVVAGLADACLLGALCGAGLLLFALGDFLITGPPFHMPGLPRPGGIAGGSLAAVAYLALGWALAGRSPGKLLVGLRLVSASGRALPPGRSVLRAVLCVLFPVGLAWALVSRRSASVQDLLLRTAVLYDRGRYQGAGHRGTGARRP
ncbi:RDD family protein [Streptomyces sp. ODS28]|uniref:RDD family protein n=1 Tax=Streptomyces sp. ODS28 TaxID=3136688 RepID=UPI0031ED1929